MEEPLVVLENIRKKYEAYGLEKTLDVPHLEVARGEFLFVRGLFEEDGARTLGRIIGCIEHPDEGNVWFDGVNMTKFWEKECILKMRGIGYINLNCGLLPTLSVMENITLPELFNGLAKEERYKRAENALKIVGLEKDLYDKKGSELEELLGTRKVDEAVIRALIARALVSEPKMILAEDVTSRLNLQSGWDIIELLTKIYGEGKTIVAYPADLKYMEVADRTIFVRNGQVMYSSVKKT